MTRFKLLASAVMLALSAGAAACGSSKPVGVSSTTDPAATSAPGTTAPLRAPRTSAAQDGLYYTDLARVDPALAKYVNKEQNVALRALLTDGAAFCAFLQRGGGVDNAMISVAVGARSIESATHLPLSVTTFNAIDSVALLALCPSEEPLIPAADRTKLQALAKRLGANHH